LALLLTAMILLAPLQIFLRNFFDQGISWADPVLRVLVLWVGLLGAVAASRGGRHITIDVLSKLAGARAQVAVRVVTGGFAAGICGVVAWHAGRFVASEYSYESIAFSGIPAWMLQVIIPFAFGVIGLRYLLQLASDVRVLFTAPASSGDAPR
jgi:TRAP-type C4-dicarboxylate transport system permease small subunit